MRNETICCLDELAAEILQRAGIFAPPVDARQVARALGLTVAHDDGQLGRARLVRQSRQSGLRSITILIRHDPRAERMQWSIAHEIGEALAVQAFERLDWDARVCAPGLREQVANRLASGLLLPSEWFAHDAGVLQGDLIGLKARYCTASHELIARRLLDFPPEAMTTIFDQGRLTRRLGNLTWRLPPLLPCEREAQRQAFATGGYAICHQEEATCRAWAVHETSWKREILRTELEA